MLYFCYLFDKHNCILIKIYLHVNHILSSIKLYFINLYKFYNYYIRAKNVNMIANRKVQFQKLNHI